MSTSRNLTALVGLLVCLCAGSAFAQPANDNCTAATAVGEGVFPFDNIGATLDGPIDGDGNMGTDVWFLYTATVSGTATIETCGTLGTLDDSVLIVYDGAACPIAGDTGLANDDDGCSSPNFSSTVSIPVAAGDSLLVQVGGWNGATGTSDLTIAVTPPANDNCVDAAPVGEGTIDFNNLGATLDGPTDGDSNMDSDVWFLYTATVTDTVAIETCGSTGSLDDTVLIVYDGTACPIAGDLGLASDDDGCTTPNFSSTVSLAVTAGNTYLVQVGGWNGAQGESTLAILPPTAEDCTNGVDDDFDGDIDCADADCAADPACLPPANDDCVNATPVGEGSFAYSNENSTLDGPTDGDSNMTTDVWFLYTATAGGLATIDTCATTGTLTDTVIIVYDGAACPVAGDGGIANDDDSCGPSGFNSGVSVPVAAGDSLLVQVGGWNGTTGTGTLTIGVEGPANDDCVDALAVGPGSHDFFNLGATLDGPTDGDSNMSTDVWFLYTAVATGPALITTCGTTGSLDDTVMIVYDGAACPIAGDLGLANDDDSCGSAGFNAEVSIAVTAGSTYLVQVGGWNGTEGVGTLDILEATPESSVDGNCSDGIDNDFDGFADCADIDCAGIDAACIEAGNCNDGIDNDLDGLADCADTDCDGDPLCDLCPSILTQTIGTAVDGGGSVACPSPNENYYARSFDLGQFSCPDGARVLDVTFGIQVAVSPDADMNGTPDGQTIEIRVYSDSSGGAPNFGDMTLLSSEPFLLEDAMAGTTQTVVLTTPAEFYNCQSVVLVVYNPGLAGADFRMGTTAGPESGPSYLASTPCGLADFGTTAGLGFPDSRWILQASTDELGLGVCGDECLTALPVTEGANPIDTTGFTDSAEPDPTGCTSSFGQNVADGWYLYTPAFDGNVAIDTCDPAGFDSDLSIYDGSCGALNLLDCDGDGNGAAGCQSFDSLVEAVVTGGSTYFIRVGGWEPGEEGPGTLNITLTPLPPTINEIRIDQPGADNDEFFELAGNPQSLDGLWYIVIGDGTGGSGEVEAAIDLTGNSIGVGGFFVAAESTFTLGVADLVTTLEFENSDNVTHLLVRDFTGLVADDLDTDDDGVFDVTPWTEVIDCVALVETFDIPASGEHIYCAATVGPEGTFVPGSVERCPDGFGTWQIGNFDHTFGENTAGGPNSCLTPPANDECVSATEIFVGDTPFWNGSATASPEPFTGLGTPDCGTGIGSDIWYSFTAPANGSVVLDTCNLISFDSNVEMFSGDCASLSFIGGSCDSTGCAGFSATSDPIGVTGGETYLIRLGTWNADPGGFGVFRINFAPEGDECDDPIVVTEGVTEVDTTLANDSEAPAGSCPDLGGTGNDIWLSYTPAMDGTVDITTCDLDGFDTDLVVYTGDCLTLTEVACDGDAPSDPGCQSFYSFVEDLAVTGGTEYLIRVGGWNGSTGVTDVTITFEPLAVPPTAAFVVAPLEGIAPLDVTLTDSSDNGMDPAATIDIAWGDSSNDNGLPLGSVVAHSYAAGSYMPSLTVNNAAGSDSLVGPAILAVAMGDCNKDGSVDIADALSLADYLFSGGAAPGCANACDVNGDGNLDLGDTVYTLYYLFVGGSAPVQPAAGTACD